MKAAAAQLDVMHTDDLLSKGEYMIDPLLIIFVPYAVALTGVLASPLLIGRAIAWRRGAARLNASSCCGRCERTFALDSDFHLYLGRYICAACAQILRRRWRIGLAIATVGVGAMAVGAGGAFIADIAAGGSGLQWWLGPRLLALLLPSAGLAAAIPFVLRVGRNANRLEAGSAARSLPPGA